MIVGPYAVVAQPFALLGDFSELLEVNGFLRKLASDLHAEQQSSTGGKASGAVGYLCRPRRLGVYIANTPFHIPS